MRVTDVMHWGVQEVPPHAPLHLIATTMRDADVGSLAVVEDGRIVGIVTDRDLAVRGLADGVSQGLDVDELTARDVMSVKVVTCREADPVDEAVELMARHQVRRLPVLDAAGAPVGMLSFGDIAHAHRPDFADEVAKAVTAHHA